MVADKQTRAPLPKSNDFPQRVARRAHWRVRCGQRKRSALIGVTSLGKSSLRYMVTLKPALEARDFEVAVFHTTDMGGRAFEALAAQGRFAAMLDLSV
jgi:uncharacterized protein (UPF0261 family)